MANMKDYLATINQTNYKISLEDEKYYWVERKTDETTSWIDWEYTHGEYGSLLDSCFRIHFGWDENENLTDASCIVGEAPCGEKVYIFIGEKSFDDCRTIEEGIVLAIKGLYRIARHNY